MKDKKKYVIITPARDEEKYIEMTIESVISQTIRPIEWVIVNDGSSDNTGIIIDKYSKIYNWIRPLHREDRGYRKAGYGVMEAFYDGYNYLKTNDWEFIVKLDGDLSFDSYYFENCFKEFDNNKKLGIGGGIIANEVNGKFKDDKIYLFHVRGATKIYQRNCWLSIGGLLKTPGWDTIDEVKANMLGWETKHFAEYTLKQHRQTGAAEGAWANWVKNGSANYISGYHPIFMFTKCIKKVFQRPYIVASLGLFWGFTSSYLKKIHQIDDPHLISYLRKQQIRRIYGLESIWK